MKKNLILHAPLKLNLQMFAEGGDGGSDDGVGAVGVGQNGQQGTSGDDDKGNDSANKPSESAGEATAKANPNAVSFASQAELDALVASKINDAKNQWQTDAQKQKAYEDMTPAEKQTYDLKQTQDALAQEKLKTLTLTNKATLSARLATDKLPGNLIEMFGDVLGQDEKAIDAAYTKVSGIFRDAVKAGVDQRLSASAGAPGATNNGASESAGEATAKARNAEPNVGKKNPWAIHG
ncbi:DUF4355 domain-containing protein [Lacticaseibacillus yichunensis]|uniref:DUF4355 domain-containing protein n=1 Tax=Lacticaseibacillus yichunensis TaxID=2486015 RepID=A0ABW4CM51_9LACO|nr:DUF4355 domain-containing protein [Lacticaseibacillus yichunensis]